MTKKPWSPESWQNKPIAQQPSYDDPSHLENVLAKLQDLPPLVFSGEVDQLCDQLARAGRGEVFVLQGGDCAERFVDCNRKAIESKLKILLQMSVVLCYGLRKPVIRIGRIAGQYAKPRSNTTESVNGVDIPVYRGDIINGFEADEASRKPDPDRILKAYHHSAATLNYIRALTKGGFADLHFPQHWNLDFINTDQVSNDYQKILDNIRDAIAFMESLGSKTENLSSIEFYTSHEGLLLPVEQAHTFKDDSNSRHYNLGAHMLWIGDRTRHLDGAHIEYFRGVANPVGIKVGPSADPSEIAETLEVLNPNKREGKLVLITRYGQGKVNAHLPQLIKTVQACGVPVTWSCDPMHGNGSKSPSGLKTRDFQAILSELTETFAIHREHGSIVGGIHFELTGDNVTECLGGSAGITNEHLSSNYETYCDPRLNYSQSLEMAFLVSKMLADYDKKAKR